MWETGKSLLIQALQSTAWQALYLLIPLLLTGTLIHFCSNLLEIFALRLLGLKAYLYLIAWPGTLVHELGHAIFCSPFGHRIDKVRLLSFSTRNQSTGYVSHSYSGRNPWHLLGNFFISIGPLLLGSLVVILSLRYLAGVPVGPRRLLANANSLVSAESIFSSLKVLNLSLRGLAYGLVRSVDWTGWRTWLAAYLILSVGSAMTLSREDLSAAAGGLGVLLLLGYAFNLALALTGISAFQPSGLLPWTLAGCLVLIVVLTVLLPVLLVLWLLVKLTGR